MLMPLLRWCSGSQKDLLWCQEVNKYLFSVDNNIMRGLLYIGLQDKNVYQKYPKASKTITDKVFELQKDLAKRFYFWSEQECQRNLCNFVYIDWNEVALALGCDTKERKLLGLSEIKIKKEVTPAKKTKTLFDF
ncbi:MAG: hypothetical protein WC929_05815 [Bacilli bacterium]